MRESARPHLDGPIMTRAVALLFLLLLAACSDEKPPKQAINEMIESPLHNTVISSFETYPPRPAVVVDSASDVTASIPSIETSHAGARVAQ
jgi:hypothetical protein